MILCKHLYQEFDERVVRRDLNKNIFVELKFLNMYFSNVFSSSNSGFNPNYNRLRQKPILPFNGKNSNRSQFSQ